MHLLNLNVNTNEKLKLCKLSFELNIDKKFEKKNLLRNKIFICKYLKQSCKVPKIRKKQVFV